MEIVTRSLVERDRALAVARGLQRFRTRNHGAEAAWWSRITRTLARTPAGWRIIHEHDSVPFHVDGRFRAAVDLEDITEGETAMPEDTAIAIRPDPSVMHGVIPYFGYAGRAAEALDFYARAFGATELGRMPDADNPGRLMHAQIEINGGAYMVTDMGCEHAGAAHVGAMHMQLVVVDGRRWWDRALAAGCKVVQPYERQFWGDDWGMLADPFGIRWAVLQPGPEHAT